MAGEIATLLSNVAVIVPALFAPDRPTAKRFLEFFAARLRTDNTRAAYIRAINQFTQWCDRAEVYSLQDIEPLHVAAYIEGLKKRLAAPSVKQHLAALRHLFDWLVVCQVVAVNPAGSVRGPAHSVKKGKTKVLSAEETRLLLDSMNPKTVVGLRDRALIALMVFTFARVGAAIQMRVEDVFVEKQRTWIRLYEKGNKEHVMPCKQQLEQYLRAYIKKAKLKKGAFLFPTADWKTGKLFQTPMRQADAYRMVRRRAKRAGIMTKIGNHSFRATGITEYLRNDGKLEVAQQMANHESSRTTGLYDRRSDDVTIDEVDKIVI
jgi:site-specific recombinase XerD